MIQRHLKARIEKRLFKGKVIIIYGARRVGKTTLSKQITENLEDTRYLNCELLQNKSALSTTNSGLLKDFLGNYRMVVLDEAQHIDQIGLVLKILADTFPEMQIIATGSSSFDLGQKISEPLTGRARHFVLYPLSFTEIADDSNLLDTNAGLDNFLRFGFYPEVVGKPEGEAIEELNEIASSYLYKDVLQFERLKRPDLLFNLLKALALQIGSEVSFQELSRLLGTSVHTIKRYIELLEQSFVIFRLNSLSGNLRNEISKGQKIYFNDIGIRNAIIQNFSPLSTRNDVGALWENFCISERFKYHSNQGQTVNAYFWRSYFSREVDYIEEKDGLITAFEFKYSPKRNAQLPNIFRQAYPDAIFKVVNNNNYISELFF
ncbi:MAG: ATP-binding protein [Lentimicrobium sp.]|jgi:predicted AAA+ superfamily ATPase|uniref:ATP-binding protein n=1 Tax=Lentimicrobium sp. TaxID=2034841 RepID=UPI0025D24A19|nr:ATP-binding protein [Lentimicrobium sp.]MCO5258376.1 ATP-binding protein [Lentimicrobium sp.]HPF64990.1 ATP-binding protein [Lentimicrobium sp.]HRW68339.1 ATP-binding protein [Lentimicrobium sp.]